MTDVNTDLNLKLHMRQCIQKVATGPEYSKDLSYEDAYHAMRHILSGEADPVQVAVYFIALRMKRETDEENRGTLQALIDGSVISTAAVDEIFDISDRMTVHTRGSGFDVCAGGVGEHGCAFGIARFRAGWP
jgi:Anthranilate phosphoribosyltransferase